MNKTNFKCMYLIDEKLYKKKILDGEPALYANNNKMFSNSMLESYPRTEFVRREYDIASTVGQQGPAGPTGSQGEKGSVGPSGAEGVKGSVGPSGPSGVEGLTGPPGRTGAEGAVGRTGPSGPLGAVGAAGQQGPPGSIAMAEPVGLVAPHLESVPKEDQEDCAHCQLSDEDMGEPISVVSDQRSSKRKRNDEIELNLQEQKKYATASNKEPDSDISENAVLDNEELIEMKEWLRKMRTDIDFPPSRHTHEGISKSKPRKKTNYLVCTFCRRKFISKKNLKSHISNVHSAKKQLTQTANENSESYKRKYETDDSNASHFKKPKSDGKTEFKGRKIAPPKKKATPQKIRFICTYCFNKFPSKMLLKRHILIFHPAKKNLKPTLKAQIETHQAEQEDVSYFCSICERRFSREKSLSNHVRRFHKEYFEQWERDSKRKRTSEPEGVYVKRQKKAYKPTILYRNYF